MLTGGPYLSAAGVGVAYPFGRGRLSGWAGWLARGPFLFFCSKLFLFLFLKQKALFCNKFCTDLNHFKFATFV
jgi:hypothetical protein